MLVSVETLRPLQANAAVVRVAEMEAQSYRLRLGKRFHLDSPNIGLGMTGVGPRTGSLWWWNINTGHSSLGSEVILDITGSRCQVRERQAVGGELRTRVLLASIV